MFKNEKDFIVTRMVRMEVDLNDEQFHIFKEYLNLFKRLKGFAIKCFENTVNIDPELNAPKARLADGNTQFSVDVYKSILHYCEETILNSSTENYKRFKSKNQKTLKCMILGTGLDFITTDILGDVYVTSEYSKLYRKVKDGALEFTSICFKWNPKAKMFFVELSFRTDMYQYLLNDIPYGAGIGIDVGADIFMALSDGTTFENYANSPEIKALLLKSKELEDEVNRLRKINYVDALKRRKIGKRIKNNEIIDARLMWQVDTKMIYYIQDCVIKICAKRPAFVATETLKNFCSDAAIEYIHVLNISYLVKFLERTCTEQGIPLVTIPADAPTSKVCSSCGSRNIRMIQRTFICDDCGYTTNRDLNAAENIRQNGEKIFKVCRKKKKGVA